MGFPDPLPITVELGLPSVNLLSRDTAIQESGVGNWIGSGTPAPLVAALAAPAGHPDLAVGANGLRITWQGSGTFPQAQASTTNLTASIDYIFSAWVYVPTGAPDVRLLGASTVGSLSAIKDKWHLLLLPFTQGASTTVTVGVRSSGSPNGSLCWVAHAMLAKGTMERSFTVDNGAWTDISADVYQRDPIQIVRGRSNESSQLDPCTANLTIDNRSGDYSARNPVSPYFGQLNRNTPLRILTPGTLTGYLAAADDAGSYATTPDSAALSITGDTDVRIDIEPATWRPVTQYSLASKWTRTGNQRSWVLHLTPAGLLQLNWSTDGTYNTALVAVSTAAIPANSTRLAVRATIDVDNGAAGRTITFYTAPTIGGSWTQLGSTVITAGTTSIFNATSDVRIGGDPFAWLAALSGKVYAFELRNGIAGTVVASPDFTPGDTLATTQTDAQGNVWTFVGNEVIVDPNARFHGEVSTFPQRWDSTGSDVYVPIVASGVTRRLGQGTAPLKSVLYRALTDPALMDVVAYWPCEDESGATELGSALPDKGPLRVITAVGTDSTLATFGAFKASKPILTLNNTRLSGGVGTYWTTGSSQIRFLLHVPAAGVASTTVLWRGFTDNSVARWDIEVNSAGSLILTVFDEAGTQLYTNTITFAVNGKLLRVSLEITRPGNVAYTMTTLEVGQDTGSTFSDSFVGGFVGGFTRFVFNPGSQPIDIAVGHVSLQTSISSIFDLGSELRAYDGEKATSRILRLCRQEGVPCQVVGDDLGTTIVGPQLPKTLLDLLKEAADADLGALFEARGFLGLAYRPRTTMYAQTPALALDYATADLSSIEPTEDDQNSRNDITVQREGGGSSRAVLETGTLSVLAPPNGIGRYDEQQTLNLSTDSQTADQASWRLHVGTVDEPRYPTLGINLARNAFITDPTSTLAAKAMDVGDRLTVANPPAWLAPDLIDQLLQGYSEVLTRFEWTIDPNCTPASPWGVGVWDGSSGVEESRYSSDGSTLNAAVSATATSLSVATPSGPLWSAKDQPFDIYVAGERMTVTNITGSTSPQTFTVTRSVNGIVKLQAAGVEVRLFKPVYYAL